MATQDLILYTYHGGRAGVEAGGDFTQGKAVQNADRTPVIDGRLGETLLATVDLGTDNFNVRFPVEQNALSDAIDTIILAGHNLNGAVINAGGIPGPNDLLDPDGTVTAINREPFLISMTAAVLNVDTHLQLSWLTSGAPTDSIVPEMTELWITTEHILQRPETGWDHGTRNAQQRFENQAGVSSTWLFGRARKVYRFTWENLTGTDLAILENLRPQTNDFTEPFWLQPPDDTFPLVLVEIDRDADWQQMFEAPLASGLGHRVTLPLVEVVA